MALTLQQRNELFALFMRDKKHPTSGITKADLQAALNAVDDWVDAATPSFLAALPEPFKSASNATEKTMTLVYVLMKRVGRI